MKTFFGFILSILIAMMLIFWELSINLFKHMDLVDVLFVLAFDGLLASAISAYLIHQLTKK